MLKVESLRQSLLALNPDIEVQALAEKVSGSRLDELVKYHDLVLDCSDNFPTRHAVNQACFQQGKPLVSGAAIKMDGQISVFDFRQSDSACYHCLFPESDEVEETRCATMGVFAPLVGVIGCLQAAEALKLISGVGRTLQGRLVLLNVASQNWREIRVQKDPMCPVCGTCG
jgi:adenylyltransferase/sulfurtransferase